jgi:dihydrodipicolinate synthase/N-acetylneuraminate lyase
MMGVRVMHLSGMIVPLVTPLTEEQEVDQASLRNILRRQLISGVDGIFVLGTMGEGNLLTDRQKLQVVETAAEISGKKVPLLCSISDTSTERVRQNIRLLKDYPVSAYVCTLPFYGKLNPPEQTGYFLEIAGFSDRPVYIYNIPSFLNSDIQIDVIRELIKDPIICGVKESTADIIRYQLLAELKNARPDFTLFTGHPRLIEIALHLGFDGAVLGMANLIPKVCRSLYQYWTAGAVGKTKDIQNSISSIFSRISAIDSVKMVYSSIAVTKYLLKEMGILNNAQMVRPSLVFEPQNPELTAVLAEWIIEAESAVE